MTNPPTNADHSTDASIAEKEQHLETIISQLQDGEVLLERANGAPRRRQDAHQGPRTGVRSRGRFDHRAMNPRGVMVICGWGSFQAIEPFLNAPSLEVVNEAFENAGLA